MFSFNLPIVLFHLRIEMDGCALLGAVLCEAGKTRGKLL